jgi:hypothetical protein
MPARNPRQSNSTWALLAITATLVTAVVLLPTAEWCDRYGWFQRALPDRSDSEEERVTQQMAPTLP